MTHHQVLCRGCQVRIGGCRCPSTIYETRWGLCSLCETPSSFASQCGRCLHARHIPGDAHIRCAQPDPGMTGNQLGIDNGWFNYPHNFDPVWRTKGCVTFTPRRTT